ncbi:hypothetical protein GCM10019071_34760 [Sphingobium fuliginis]|uniref:Mobile element protein n=1 Tax=Sphingobium fuliginis (strain ATCC 27551) TaxID=336203 RepID=A0ABQ1F6Q4_SPHSA|nr:hypothetical protein GCM10019071_34760 [Sphingobium fuliginis]
MSLSVSSAFKATGLGSGSSGRKRARNADLASYKLVLGLRMSFIANDIENEKSLRHSLAHALLQTRIGAH